MWTQANTSPKAVGARAASKEDRAVAIRLLQAILQLTQKCSGRFNSSVNALVVDEKAEPEEYKRQMSNVIVGKNYEADIDTKVMAFTEGFLKQFIS